MNKALPILTTVRATTIVNSCQTEEQLKTTKRYFGLVMKRSLKCIDKTSASPMQACFERMNLYSWHEDILEHLRQKEIDLKKGVKKGEGRCLISLF